MKQNNNQNQGVKTMTAFFTDVRSFAIFNAKPHLFTYSDPTQIGAGGEHDAVFVNLTSGRVDNFVKRVEQFDGVILHG